MFAQKDQHFFILINDIIIVTQSTFVRNANVSIWPIVDVHGHYQGFEFIELLKMVLQFIGPDLAALELSFENQKDHT
jgi:hypothetical protein